MSDNIVQRIGAFLAECQAASCQEMEPDAEPLLLACRAEIEDNCKRIEQLESERQWIPVIERLPDVGVTVLGWDRDGYHTLQVYCGKGKSGQDVWFGCNVAGGEYEDGRTGCDPAYWMPLPEPPTA